MGGDFIPIPVTTGNLQLHEIIGECKQSASFNLGNYGDISMLNHGLPNVAMQYNTDTVCLTCHRSGILDPAL